MSYITDMEAMGLKRGRAEGHKDGERTLLSHQLKLKFKTIPEKYQKKINLAEPKKLMMWAERILFCSDLNQIFED